MPYPSNKTAKQFEYMKDKWLSMFSLPKNQLRYFWLKHNDAGQVNLHFIIRSPIPLNEADGINNMLQVYQDANCGYETKKEMCFAAMKSWQGYTEYITGMSKKEGEHYPRWYGLTGTVFHASQNWSK